jgi:hypothetical protein
MYPAPLLVLSPNQRKSSNYPKLGDQIGACLERAEQCGEAAASEPDERIREQWLNLEQQWQHVVKSYRFIESLEEFVFQRHYTLPPEVDKLPKDYPPE